MLHLKQYKRKGIGLSQQDTQISGLAFIGAEFTPENVEITVSRGIITDIVPASAPITRCILPAFFNAHTHIGDTVALDLPADRPLADLVAPPNGIKHQILNSTSPDMLQAGMRSTLAYMQSRGTLGFADFREGGAAGVDLLSSVLPSEMSAVILGRDGGELHPAAAGLGLSSAHGTDAEQACAERVRAAGRLVAVHAGEAQPGDIDAAFELKPDLIIHATQFRPADIRRAADEDIAVCLCPRSNWTLHVSSAKTNPPVSALLEAGVRTFLGTDNAMFVPPDMFAECAFLMDVYGVSAKTALQTATAGWTLAGKPAGIAVGAPADLTVLDAPQFFDWSRNPLRTALVRLGSASVAEIYAAGRRIR